MNYIFSDKVKNLQASAIREILKFTSDPEVISFAAGNPAPEAFPVEKIRELSQKIFDEDPVLALQYNITEGYLPLRNKLKEILEKNGEFNPQRDDLIITSGAQQANALTAKVLCNPGDVICCESPSFIGSLNAFKSYNVKLKGIPLEEDGMNISALEQALKEGNVKIIYVISNFQNPTGLTTSEKKRKEIYALAKKYNAVVLEDNPYGNLRFAGEDIKSIKSLDDDGVVAYSRTFSKILAPGIRVGYISAPKEIIAKMTVCKQVDDVHTNIWAQVLAYNFITSADMDEHFSLLKKVYKAKCELMLNELEKNLSSKIKYTKPQGGLFIWCTLPDGCDTDEFCKRAVAEYKVAAVPGSSFTVNDGEKSSSFRLNFSTPTDEQIVSGCEKLGRLSKEMFGE